MKNEKSSRIARVIKRIINIRSWVDYDRMKSFTLYLLNGFKKMFVPQSNVKAESFDAALKRLNISDKELKAKQVALYRLSLLMCAAAFLIFTYSIYHVFYGSLKAVIVSFVVMLIALVLAFRYHFWYFQIKERKLGCSLREWYSKGFMGEKE